MTRYIYADNDYASRPHSIRLDDGRTVSGIRTDAQWLAAGGTISEAPGDHYRWQGGDWVAIPLAELQAAAITANRAECTSRIYAVWPPEKQASAALGVYPGESADECSDWIAAHIAAENIAADLIAAATDAAGVAAVEVVWP